MTMNFPVRLVPVPPQKAPLLHRWRRQAKMWWQDLVSVLRSGRRPVELEPFGYLPAQASALIVDERTEAPAIPGYAFHTNYVASAGWRVRFKIRLCGLRAMSGQLALAINQLNDHGKALESGVKSVSLSKLAANGGIAEISMPAVPGYSYAVMGALTDGAQATADRITITMTGGEPDNALAARLAAARKQFLAAPGTGILAPIIVDRRATLSDPISQMCTAEQMREPVYAEWCRRMGSPMLSHRKQWEFIYICRALEYHGALRNGARGLGFGVGMEPMPSVFAAAGCDIVATDLPAEDDRATLWNATKQLGASLDHIHMPDLCDRETFFERVSYRPIDMNAIPADLTGFDFTWSSCAYEHLGSIEAGLTFFERSLACLKPGGIAVHTTELNLSSNEDTLDHIPVVLFRRRDFEALATRLIGQGHEVMPITFDSGDTELDRVIDLPPYSGDLHLKLALLRWVSTSFGMIVKKKS